MDCVAPQGPVYQAGTLSGNPIAMAAGLAQLHYLNNNPATYHYLEKIGEKLVNGLKGNSEKLGLDYTINHIGSMFTQFFTNKQVNNLNDAKLSDTIKFGQYFQKMLHKGVYLAPSQFESMFLSTAIEDKHIDIILEANLESLQELA